MNGPCCSPGSSADPSTLARSPASTRHLEHASGRRPVTSSTFTRLVGVRGGRFLMGTADADAVPGDGEGPVREVTVADFGIGAHCVSNDEFAAFVDDTGFVTDAERAGWSFVFEGFVADRVGLSRAAEAPWWVAVPGAGWRSPEGPGSGLADRPDHPVVHVSWDDATAYCRWAGLRLPSEPEWEYAARGGLEQARFPWGDELTPGGRHRCNIWQGDFPSYDAGADGYVGTAPVSAYQPNGYGLFNTSGNVWEWTADPWQVDGQGLPGTRVIRGGSYLCHDSYCNRYRVSARTLSSPTSSAGHQGFRCAL